ncbi:MAG TPA: trimethylamine methyltransferase family protein [Gammaproteobacteria bacterium]|nr:trimethylamine methyltransferase family protein [Gammaproteobacteria bacterium]
MSRRSTLRARRGNAAGAGLRQLPYRRYENPYPPFEILSSDHVEAIHGASLDILETIGVNFLLDEARRVLKEAGAEVEPNGTRVRFQRGLILDAVSRAPSAFDISARNPEHSLHFGGRSVNFAAVSSPPNASDLDHGRRTGSFEDFCSFLKLTQSVNVAQIVSGHAVEPVDIDTPIRHLVATRAMIELTDKIFRLYSLGRQRVMDVLEMVKIARGLSEDQLAKEPSVFTMVNANSPLQYDIPMLWGMIELASRNQPVVVTPFTLAGAMAPVTLAGALAQQNAEALAGMAFCQMVNPGAPVMYGGFTSNVDMKSGAPAFGTPEYAKATLAGGQLARRYNLPYRSSGVNSSNAPDAQAAYESQMALWSAVLGHAHMIHHALGWLEGGLCASFEKFIIDAEMVQMMTELLKPVEVSADTLALDAIREVGPGGHFFGAAHTLDRYETAFYPPMLSDWRNFETWKEAGAEDATQRANRIFKSVIERYESPPLDEGVREALNAFVDKRTAEGGAPVN